MIQNQLDRQAKSLQFKLPDIGEGIAEGEIVKWFVKPGDTINEDDTLLEVQNDKSVEEIPSPVTGTVKNVIVPEGTVANVGDVLVEIDAPGHNSAPSTSAPSAEAPKEKWKHQVQQVSLKLPIQINVYWLCHLFVNLPVKKM